MLYASVEAASTFSRGSTGVMTEWQKFVTCARRHGITDPKLVCIDIQQHVVAYKLLDQAHHAF